MLLRVIYNGISGYNLFNDKILVFAPVMVNQKCGPSIINWGAYCFFR